MKKQEKFELMGMKEDIVRGLSKYVDLKLVSRREFCSGAVAMLDEPRSSRWPHEGAANR